MKRAAWVLGLAMMCLSACTESFDLSFTWTSEVAPQRSVTVDNIDGNVRLRKGPAGSQVTGTIKVHAAGFKEKAQAEEAAKNVQIVETVESGNLVLSVAIPAEHRNKTFNLTFDLLVPENAAVSVVTDNGRVSVTGLTVGNIDTTNAPVDLAFTKAPLGVAASIRTNDGPVTADSHDGAIDVATSNAPVELFSIAGNTRVSTTNGHIQVRAIPPLAGEVFLATTNAEIDLGVPRDFGARVLAVTSAPGSVSVSSDLNFRPTGSAPNQAEGVLGNGAGRVDVRTISGDIFIHR
ncbi:MAG: DUF4097 family beta strand repeat protein [Deltaproteobacteria bacterium]|nr:DUF4097 family beta strand repeat protein [Deltaproteobacteria bacterium]